LRPTNLIYGCLAFGMLLCDDTAEVGARNDGKAGHHCCDETAPP
jgi:hypothetical protein